MTEAEDKRGETFRFVRMFAFLKCNFAPLSAAARAKS